MSKTSGDFCAVEINGETYQVPWNKYLVFLDELADATDDEIKSRLQEMIQASPGSLPYCEDVIQLKP